MNTENMTLEQRLARIEAIEEIRTLKNSYHTLINDTEFDKVSLLFTEDALVNLGYLMPSEKPVVGRSNIDAAFSSMKTNEKQSQVKQFLHSHIIDLNGPESASGTGILYACYGVRKESYIVAGKYTEVYRKIEHNWLFEKMELTLYFTVPINEGWAGHKRHYLVNSGKIVPDYDKLVPNPPV